MKWSRWGFPFVLSLFFSFALAGVVMTISDDEDPVGAARTVWVNDIRSGATPASRQEIDEGLSEFAVRHHVGIARVRPDRERPDEKRMLYVADSPTGGMVTREAFSSGIEQDVLPLSQDPEKDPRAFYHIYGDGDQAIGLEQFFKERGYVVQEFPPFLSPHRLFYVMGGYLAPLIGLVLIFTVVAVAAMALLSAREFGVLRLHGHGKSGIFLKALCGSVPTIGVGCVLGIVAALATLRLYNGGSEMWLFARTGLLFTAVLWAVCLASLGLGIALAAGRRIPDALNGRVDTVPAVAAVAFTHLVVVLLVATAGVSVLVLTSAKDRAEQRVDVASQHSSPVGYVSLSGSVAGNGREITKIVAKG